MNFTEFYARKTGSNLNAGSTNTDSPVFTTTGGDWVQSTRVFTKTGAITGVSVGDFASIYADGASGNTPCVARITNVTSDAITLDATAMSGSFPADGTANRTIRVGGAWGGSGSNAIYHVLTFPIGVMVNTAGDRLRVNIQGGSEWAITSGVNRSGGPLVFEGYTTSAGDGGYAVISSGTANISIIAFSGSGFICSYLVFKSTATTNTNTLAGGTTYTMKAIFYRCIFYGSRGLALSGAGVVAVECEAYDCNTSNTADLGAFGNGVCVRCVSHDHTTATTNGNGFVGQSAYMTVFIDCISDRCNGAGIMFGQGTVAIRCNTYNCINGAKTNIASGQVAYLEDCNFVLNSEYGINVQSSSYAMISNNNGFQGNPVSSDQNSTALAISREFIASTALGSNPYVDVSTGARPTVGDFSVLSGLGRGAGSGAFLQSSAFYSSVTTSYPDRGAVQSQSSGLIVCGEY